MMVQVQYAVFDPTGVAEFGSETDEFDSEAEARAIMKSELDLEINTGRIADYCILKVREVELREN